MKLEGMQMQASTELSRRFGLIPGLRLTLSLGPVLWSGLLLILWMAEGLPAQEVDGSWPQFRGPTGMGISTEKGLPVQWSPEENIAWKVALPGPGASSPVLLGQKIFLTCYSGYGVPGEEGEPGKLARLVVCLDRANGKIRWTKSVAAKATSQPLIGSGEPSMERL